MTLGDGVKGAFSDNSYLLYKLSGVHNDSICKCLCKEEFKD